MATSRERRGKKKKGRKVGREGGREGEREGGRQISIGQYLNKEFQTKKMSV